MCEKTNIRPPSKATMKIQWIPYMYADDGSGAHAGSDKKHKHHKCAVISMPGKGFAGPRLLVAASRKRPQLCKCAMHRVLALILDSRANASNNQMTACKSSLADVRQIPPCTRTAALSVHRRATYTALSCLPPCRPVPNRLSVCLADDADPCLYCRLTGWMHHHKSHDKKGPSLSAAEAAEGRGASFTAGRRTDSGSLQGTSPGQVGPSVCIMMC